MGRGKDTWWEGIKEREGLEEKAWAKFLGAVVLSYGVTKLWNSLCAEHWGSQPRVLSRVAQSDLHFIVMTDS